MKIAVLGGNGYLGGRVAQGLSRVYDTTIFSRSPCSLDLCDNVVIEYTPLLWELLIDFDVVISCVGVNRNEASRNPDVAIQIKRLISLSLAKLSQINKVSIIYASSKHVYSSSLGSAESVISAGKKDWYSAGHLEAEKQLMEGFSFDRGADYQIMRLSNCFGSAATDSREFFNLFLNKVILGVLHNNPIKVDRPEIYSSFTPLKVVVDYIISGLSSSRRSNDIVDIGVPYCFQLGHATRLIERILESNYPDVSSLPKSNYGIKFIDNNPHYSGISWFIDEVEEMRDLYGVNEI